MTTYTSPGTRLSIKSGDAEIIASASVHAFDGKNLSIELDDLTFNLKFRSDKEDQRIKKESITNKEVTLKVYNFNNPLGVGITEPIKMGRYKKKDLYFQFTSYSLPDDEGRIVNFTFSVKGADDE